MSLKVKIPADSLQLGMYVVELDRPWLDVPLMFQKFMIKREVELKTLKEYCQYVYIEVDEQFWSLQKDKLKAKAKTAPLPENTPLHHELKRAHGTYEAAREEAINLFELAKMGMKLDISHTRRIIQSCMISVMSNANALFWLTRIKDKSQFTAEHSVRVAILAIALGKYLKLDEQQLELLGLCGMLHDLGKTQIPEEIVDKPCQLTEVELRVMQKHTILGYELVNSDHSINSTVKDVIKNHHAHIDGTGYPKLPAEQISFYCRIISIVDAYDTMTSDTCYSRSSSARDALKELFNQRNKQFDGELVEAFIRMLGIYPPGTLVEMSNGEVGIVISTHPEKKLKPKVELVRDSEGKLRKSLIIDLSKSPSDKSGMRYSIKRPLADGAMGFDMRSYIQQTHHIQSNNQR
ncbi:HD-GYP domain-containing protein [Kangiella aquimarina]|uniref:HD-GYP domain-containing protein n=1 Tax=Kangiella aquimarina TaxID=261965 RepID=A0ABZ0X2E4_9GAMM|nr:HD-GYP domain-containing protein [Kangiella aquimarina]WQG84569.1 HD-GYP domain-containing protein [Kangiella aquimarina]